MRTLATLLVLFAHAAPLWAQPIAVVATGRDTNLDAVAAEAEVLARSLVISRGRDVVNISAPDTSASASLETARARLAAGETAYADLDTVGATRNLKQAVTLLLAELDRTGADEDLALAFALLGSVHHQSGDKELAARAFRSLTTLRPTYVLPEDDFPDTDRELLQNVQDELAFTSPGTLVIESGGLPAAVFFNGRYRGTTPLRLTNVEAGRHAFLVRRQGYAPRSGSVDVGGDKPVEITSVLVPPEGGEETLELVLDLTIDPYSLHPTLLALGERIGNPETIAMVAEVDPTKGRMLRVVRALPKDGVLLGFAEIELKDGWQQKLKSAIARMVDVSPEAVVAGAGQAAPEAVPTPEEESDGSVLWWIAGAGGGAVVLAAVAGAGVAAALFGPDLLAAATPPAAAAPAPPPQDTAAAAAARRRVVLGF